jgi:DNA-binding Xre family transcriptional regulator
MVIAICYFTKSIKGLIINFMNIGKSLKIALINRNMKNTTLAEKLGVSDAYVSAIACGTKSVSLTMLKNICDCLDYKTSEFIALGE